ncbi:hypothetical protein QMG61_11580 [Cryobacterium sp. PH31-AA6]|uniref:hypothetical protein n=1 Tax=Cryobacterium sp. PH31-AA6 TaxID=3046205 RepID=UPI0024B8F3E3|nr:hypothetical protein [Cryobacterium sp. PH31-AA6]MDJ0324401.1 hypothetical protein [Cryobacterium sp. PH31-AA6]
MSAIWVSVWLAAAAVAAGLAAVCALAALRMPGRAAAAAPSMVVMAASTLDMALPNAHLLSPLAWAALLVGATLLALLDRGKRVAAAHHAAALLLMAVMWCAMLPGLPGVNPAIPASVTTGVTATAHSGHGQAWTGYGALLGWLVLAASVALAASAVRTARRRTGWQGTSVAERLEAAQHVGMALAMAAMTAGMFLPLSWP